MGSINSRGNRIFFDFRYRDRRHREYTKLKDTPANRKRAKMILERLEAEIVLGSFDYAKYFPNSPRAAEFASQKERIQLAKSSSPLFKEFAELWFSEHQIGWKHSYKETLRGSLEKHLYPSFGDKPVDVIKKADILAFRAGLASINRSDGSQGLSPARINHIMTPLRMILNEAADRYEFDTPYKNIKPLKVPKTNVEPFSLDEVRLILKHVRKDFHNYYCVRFFTGMRTGEVHGLKWKYIDFERRQILIRESFVSGRMTTTKTDGSAREIYMSDPVLNALQEQNKVTGKYEFVFCNTEGNPLSVNNVTKRVWYPLLRLLNLTPRRPYQARHTAATLWLAAGENPEWVARQLGHSSTEMLFTVYSRYVPNLTRQDGSAFARLLSQQLPEYTRTQPNEGDAQ
jgi:integrase